MLVFEAIYEDFGSHPRLWASNLDIGFAKGRPRCSDFSSCKDPNKILGKDLLKEEYCIFKEASEGKNTSS